MVSGIGADGERDSESRAFRDHLQLIVGVCKRSWIAAKSRDEAVDADLANDSAGHSSVIGSSDARYSKRTDTASGAMHHHAGLLRERHSADEILRTRRRG